MNENQETLVETNVRYNIEFKGKHIVIENLPVHMNEESEEYYVSSTVIEYLINVVLEQFTEASEAEEE
ncbi:hypothetical protein Riv7116_6667 [Rivularia sp. PCC 7116]|uniref:hypothetical protein n=1 Tax=Rivularia sp. PCC 7116 TaxID=373994 RepID=UPI00029F32B3|nr:hypothetical protein [Rivularia sp. PCC 7116]AFY58989.1 hypothetical protein Riv7116_6667 [Rivularia sp. PCC 7116]